MGSAAARAQPAAARLELVVRSDLHSRTYWGTIAQPPGTDSTPPRVQNGPGIGAVDWIAGSLAGLLLISATACAPAAGSSPPAPAAAVESSAAGASAAPTRARCRRKPTLPRSIPSRRPASACPASAPHQQPAYASKALDVLATLPVKGRAPKTGYSRDQFGQAWADVDRNGCDTRNDILRRDLTAWPSSPAPRTAWSLSGVAATTPTRPADRLPARQQPPARRCRSTTSSPSATPGRRAPSSSPRPSGSPSPTIR